MDTKVKVELETQQAYTSIKDLRQALKQTKDEMVGLEAGSDAFRQVAKKAGELQHQIDEISQSVRGASSDLGDMLGNATKTTAGIIGAFQAAKGAMNLFGVESENVTEAIQKMQSLMAMTQGLASIDEGIKAFKKLKTAIDGSATSAKILKTVLQPKTLLAITAAIGALYLIWQKWGDSIKNSIPFIDELSKAFNKLKGDTEAATSAARDYDAEIKALGGTSEQLTKQSKISKLNKEASKQYKELGEQAKLYRVQLLELEKDYEKHNITRDEYLKKGLALIDQETQAKNAQDAILANEANYIEKTKDVVASTEDRTKSLRAEEYELLRIISLTDAQRAAYEASLGKEFKPQTVTEDESVEDDPEEQKILARGQALLEYYQLISDKYKEQQLSDEEYYANAQIALDKALELKLLSQEEYAIAVENLNKEMAESEEATLAQTLDRINQVGQIAFGALGDTLSAFAEMQDTTTKEGFEQQKKLQIASTTMNMLGGVLSAWTSAMNPANAWMTLPGQIAMGAAQTVATIAMGAAQIAKIKQTKFDGGGASAGAASANVRQTAIVAPVQYTQDVQGAEITRAIKDTRVYVTESDITNTQRKVNVAESESRF